MGTAWQQGGEDQVDCAGCGDQRIGKKSAKASENKKSQQGRIPKWVREGGLTAPVILSLPETLSLFPVYLAGQISTHVFGQEILNESC
ncbi:MAG: hypothetical protein ACU836_15230 [Gammaproteobacteria bacterium]